MIRHISGNLAFQRRVLPAVAIGLLSAGCSDPFSTETWVLRRATQALYGDEATRPTSSFAGVEKAWPPIAADEGRLVLFSSPANAGQDAITIAIDRRCEISVGPWRFVFIDLPAGDHLVESRYERPLHRPNALSLAIDAGRVRFVGLLDDAQVLPVDETEARSLLGRSHHELREPLPYDHRIAPDCDLTGGPPGQRARYSPRPAPPLGRRTP